ncbi:asparagine synthase (glutamine-hydrolyzing) [Streptococcus cuniculi]|uniref:asparagine synthase (glutamine-hydrolyzing) n=1 Tax=Streptococcus cuniculi TaxID=1432788 RepID=A0A4Y9J767_9STRE|nr:asparagine synthase (glutamine-hydrolyzing) [Streptococcus cuniculi]MBF0779309.1 asparagine synthase (glutamine-hydrolyzing) [Streptococcus cuniculi]TFU96687.1 asparagine synthase (glutamine-hydrolyzing) [Streptococcus cuniculi]
MCGFVGFYSNTITDKNVVKEMSDQIAHRGPDSDGYYFDKGINFGFRRLSIIDLNEGSQPILNESNDIAIIFNGEIYNYQEIREDLVQKGYHFKTHTDTEVILHGYEEYGEEGILSKLRGMFAFTIWDSKQEKLFGARDHFGIKPYYYSVLGEDFIFGSEVKSFLRFPNFEKKINEEALKHYLVFQYNPLEETFFKGVKKLRPGHYYTYQNGKLDIKRYYTIRLDYEDITFDEAVSKIEKEVEQSVEYHKISDVEVGSFLSGGVDSSYVVATALPNKTFSVGFDNEGFDETMYAKELSDTLGIQNYSKIISPDEFFEGIEKVQYFSDEPHANLSAVPLYFLSKLASKQVKVVLSGEGADELFAGYNEYEEALPQKVYKLLPFSLRQLLYRKLKDKPHFRGKSIITKYGQKVEDRYIGQAEIMSDDQANTLLQEKYKNSVKSSDLTKKYYDEVKDMDDVSKKLYLDMNMWIVDDILLKADKMTMANSIELRVPLLDKKMWELARTIPVKHKVNGTTTKYAFRRAAKNKLPESWAKRRKLGFVVPFVNWIKEERYYNIVKETFKKDFVGEFFDVEQINGLLDDHYNNVENNGRKVYTIYAFLKWYEQYFN